MGQQQSQPVVQCDAECERQKRITQLKSAYNQSLNNETKDSEEVRQARKQYYTYAFGEQYYQGMESTALAKVADANIEKLSKIHENLLKDIEEQEINKRDNHIALKNMNDLLNKYRTSNDKIYSSLDSQEDILQTSRREVWYTDQRMNRLNFYGYFIDIVLKILLFISIVFFLYDKKYSSLAIVIIFYVLIMHFL